MKKVVINTRFGGFGLSHEGIKMYGELKGLNLKVADANEYSFTKYKYYIDGIEDDDHYFSDDDIDREDPCLIQTVINLGDLSYGEHAILKVIEIPGDVKYCIHEYDGLEHIAEVHRTWN